MSESNNIDKVEEQVNKTPEKKGGIIREFLLSSMAIDNRTSVFVIVFLIILVGIGAYTSMPRENFPEIKLPTIYVGTAYPGNAPLDMENLITRPIEKQINSISGINNVSSTSIQDFSTVIVEFDLTVDVDEALQEVKDAVDKAKPDLPKDIPTDPNVFELNFSEIPIMNIYVSGYEDVDVLKEYAEYLQDEIEKFGEITRVDIKGVQEKEVSINVDVQQLEARQLSLYDIENAISMENITMSGGDILSGGVKRNIRIVGEFQNVQEIENIIVKNERESIVYLQDVAEVKFDYADRESYARSNQRAIVSLDIIKRAGENQINASDKIKALVAEAKKSKFPEKLIVDVVNDTSKETRNMVSNLENSIISGVILVVLVLLFFLGLRNALFVGVAIPLSMLMGFMILGLYGTTLNMMVLFSLILALGMLVDNGIVVVENIYRLMVERGYPPIRAAKEGAGEVAWPIITSTLTTLAAFIPLLFWNDIMGEFMKYLPITLIIVLSSSLFVALIINPVLTSAFMRGAEDEKTNYKSLFTWVIGLSVLAAIFYLLKFTFWGSLFAVIAGIMLINAFILTPVSDWFRAKVLPALESLYRRFMNFALKGFRPVFFFLMTVGLLIFSIFLLAGAGLEVMLFPTPDPNYFNVYVEYPVGTSIDKTNDLAEEIEAEVIQTLKPYEYMVESVLAQVGEGTSDPAAGPSQGATPNKSRISVYFTEFDQRRGQSTTEIMESIREKVKRFPGASLTVEGEASGPPTGPPINLEISGDDFEELVDITQKIKFYLEDADLPGVEGLKLDMETGKPELMVNVDRERARRYGLSMGRIAGDIRTAVFGKEISKFKDGEDEYPIQLRFNEENRYDLGAVMNQKITFKNQSNGKVVQVPVSAVADVEFSSTYGSVKRKDLNRVITIYSNVTEGFNANDIVAQYKDILEGFEMPEGYTYYFTGEQEDQAESMAFLSRALMIAVFVIFLIIVSQFNSIAMPIIIILSVLFSTIGVFLGYVIFDMDFIIIMTGIGIISLAGIVVNNAIVLIDYINLVRQRKKEELSMVGDNRLSKDQVIDAIVEGGSTRLRPVLLTAITTILGLIPLSVGFNIDFYGLLTRFDPNIYWGGTNAVFWGPMAWTVIFGLAFATFLTLVIVPVMYYLIDRISKRLFGVGLNTK